jgi:hypothetical protein
VAAELEIGVDPLLERRGAAVLELCPFGPGDRIVEIGERRAAPEAERLTQLACGDVVHNLRTALDYLIFSNTVPNGGFSNVAGTASSGASGLTVGLLAGNEYFLVAGRNSSCGVGPKH